MNRILVVVLVSIIGIFNFIGCKNSKGSSTFIPYSGNSNSNKVVSVILNKNSTAMLVDGTEQLTATIIPTNAMNLNVTWESSDETVATVSTTGLVTAEAEGITNISVTTDDGGFTATCMVTVSTIPVPVAGVSLNKSETTIFVGNTELLTAAIDPTDATDQNLTWISFDESIATVSTSGLVTAIASGKASIIVISRDGLYTDSCIVNVPPPVTGVSLKASTTIFVGNTEQLSAIIEPANAGNQSVTWSTNNNSVATVSETGLISGISVGSATITVTTDDGAFTKDCAVTVTTPFLAADTPGDVVPVNAGSMSFNMIYANNQSSITFPIGVSDASTETLTRRFFIQETCFTNAQAIVVLQWAYDHGKFSSNPEDHNYLSSTVCEWGHQSLFTLTSYGNGEYGIHIAYSAGVWSVEPGYDNNSLVYVTWYGAVMLCQWLTEMIDGNTNNLAYSGINTTWISSETVEQFSNTGYRLPKLYTEWFYAARYLGTTAPTTEDLATECVYHGKGGGFSTLTEGYYWTPGDYASGATSDITHAAETAAVAVYNSLHVAPVKTKLPNALGLYDMSGNVWQWCDNYGVASANDIGGCWDNGDETYLQIGSEASGNLANDPAYHVGFRMAKTQ
jgi:uncharacterized protein YjdB